jgi:hypothetical protein
MKLLFSDIESDLRFSIAAVLHLRFRSFSCTHFSTAAEFMNVKI